MAKPPTPPGLRNLDTNVSGFYKPTPRLWKQSIALLIFFAKFCTPNTYGDGETKPTEVLQTFGLHRSVTFGVPPRFVKT